MPVWSIIVIVIIHDDIEINICNLRLYIVISGPLISQNLEEDVVVSNFSLGPSIIKNTINKIRV